MSSYVLMVACEINLRMPKDLSDATQQCRVAIGSSDVIWDHVELRAHMCCSATSIEVLAQQSVDAAYNKCTLFMLKTWYGPSTKARAI